MKLAWMALAVLLAACTQPPAHDLPEPEAAAAWSFSTHATGVPCVCFEPSVAVSAGKIVVADGYGGKLAVAPIGEPDNFTAVPLPPTPPGRGPRLFNTGDELVQTAPDGRLFFSQLYIDAYGMVAPVLLLDGLQVASSSDGGATWDTNTYVSFRDTPDGLPREQAINPDRQWLGFGPSGEVYLSVNHFAPTGIGSTLPGPWGIYVARSDDGGRSFGAFSLVEAHSDRGGSIYGVAGGVVTDPDGTVYLPLGDRSSSEGLARSPSGLVVSVSHDRGETFTLVPVGIEAPSASWLPRAAYAHGRLAVAWTDQEGGGHVASTADGGTSWQSLELPSTVVGPWIEGGVEGFDVAWASGKGQDYTLHVTHIPPTAWADPSSARSTAVFQGQGNHGGGDFSSLAHLPDDRVVVAWADSAQKATGIALELPSVHP